MAMQIDPDDLPGMARVEYREPRGPAAVRWSRSNQRMAHGDLVRLGGVIAADAGRSVLELIEDVAHGRRAVTGQQLRALIAALPHRHARLRPGDVRLSEVDPRELTDEMLEAIIRRAGQEVREYVSATDEA